jgi:hypothetical protein
VAGVRVARAQDHRGALTVCKEALRRLGPLVESTRLEYGRFDLRSIPILEDGLKLMALVGDRDDLAEAGRIMDRYPELSPWRAFLTQAADMGDLADQIMRRIEGRPGMLQTALYEEFADKSVREACKWLERLGRVRRWKQGRSYALFPSPDVS